MAITMPWGYSCLPCVELFSTLTFSIRYVATAVPIYTYNLLCENQWCVYVHTNCVMQRASFIVAFCIILPC